MKRLTQDERASAVEQYQAGRSLREVGIALGVSKQPIRLALQHAGIEPREKKPPKRPSPPPVVAEVLRRYAEGATQKEIAKALGLSTRRVGELIRANATRRIEAGGPRLTPEQREHAVERYKAGASLTTVAKEFGVSKQAIRALLRFRGVELRSMGQVKRDLDSRADDIVERYQLGESQQAIGDDLGLTQSAVGRVLLARGVSKFHRAGSAHGSWKGGRVLQGEYVGVKLSADDDLVRMQNLGGYVLEHRLVMARALGRPLTEHETVHHVNGDGTDNRLENLQLRQGKHGNGVALTCLDCGSTNVEAVPLH